MYPTKSIIEKSRQSRLKCWKAGLDEQEMQSRLGESDPTKIAHASLGSTKWCAKRAQKIGVLQSMLSLGTDTRHIDASHHAKSTESHRVDSQRIQAQRYGPSHLSSVAICGCVVL